MRSREKNIPDDYIHLVQQYRYNHRMTSHSKDQQVYTSYHVTNLLAKSKQKGVQFQTNPLRHRHPSRPGQIASEHQPKPLEHGHLSDLFHLP